MCVYKIGEIAEKIRPIAENYKIDKVCLFGSYARGEAVEESDIDLIINSDKLRGLKFFGLYEDLKEAFQKNVDLLTEDQIERNRSDPLYKKFIEEIENDRMVIYSLFYDYTEWRRDKFNDMTAEELNNAAAEYGRLHHKD